MAGREHPAYLWFNGESVPWAQATLHATATIWSSLMTVFEGVRAYWNPATETMHIFRLEDHLRRLCQSMRLIRLSLPYDPMILRDELPLLLQRNGVREDSYIRIVAFPAERPMASFRHDEIPVLLADTAPLASHLTEDRAVNLMVSSYTRIGEDVMPPRVKAMGNYRNGDLAATEAELAGYDGALMLNRRGEVSEATWSCLFLVRDGVLITPDLNSDVLESITRDTLLRLARERLDLAVAERRVARTELYLADEAFLCGTAAEIRPIASIDRYTLGAGTVGPITRRLQRVYEDIVRGNDYGYAAWRTSMAMAPGAVSS